MKQLGKKLLVLVLAISMMLSVIPLSVFAEPDQQDQLIQQVQQDQPVQQNTEKQTEPKDTSDPADKPDSNGEETYMAYENGSFVEKPIPADAVKLSTLTPSGINLALPINKVYVLDKNIDWPTVQVYADTNDGSITIILKDNYTLKVKTLGAYRYQTLNIYGQKNNTGKLIADASNEDKCPGIGTPSDCRLSRRISKSGPINIYGGTIEATGGKYAAGIGGNGCSVMGIVRNETQCSGPINIYGGKITAIGGKGGSERSWPNGAAIGSGAMGENADPIRIFGGEINAETNRTSHNKATAAIGSASGTHRWNNRIEITGGKVTAGRIGCGSHTDWSGDGQCHITISGNADVTAESWVGIGVGNFSNKSKVWVNIEGADIKVYARGTDWAFSADNIKIDRIGFLLYGKETAGVISYQKEEDPNKYVERAKTSRSIWINREPEF